MAEKAGLFTTESNIHFHIFTEARTNKGEIARHLFRDLLGLKDYKRQVLVIGDSLNDEPMFDPKIFPLSCGVANIRNYLPSMVHKPAFVASNEQGWGVIEIIDVLLSS
jgi:hypothetical protein